MLIDVKTESGSNLSAVSAQAGDLQGIEDKIEESLALFVKAIEETINLSIIGTSFNKEGRESFIIEDSNVKDEHIEVVVSEVIEKVRDAAIAREFVKVIQDRRSPIILNGITRIVGYFSRINNWNKSKIGELRERRGGDYSIGNC